MKKLDYVLELLKEQEMLLKEELDGFPEPIEFEDSMQKLKQVEYALNKLSIYDVSDSQRLKAYDIGYKDGYGDACIKKPMRKDLGVY